MRARAGNESTPLTRVVELPAPVPAFLVKLGEECHCRYAGSCSCSASVEFMQCISDACLTGMCHCQPKQVMDSCTNMETACPSLDFQCEPNKVTCQGYVFATGPKERLLEDLQELRAKKCELEQAVKNGWLNADNRLEEVEYRIRDKINQLKALGGTLPRMNCEDAPTVVGVPQEVEHGDGGQTAAEAVEEWTHKAAPVTVEAGETTKHGWWRGAFVDLSHDVAITVTLLGLLVIILATAFVAYRHRGLTEEGTQAHCGVFSTLCCLFCTPATICCPIDAAKF